MEIAIYPNAEAASAAAAALVAGLIWQRPSCVLGLATGSTPVLLYQELARMHREEGLDFSQVTTFNLDEYVGLPPEHPQSYHAFMRVHLFEQVNLRPERVHLPNGLAEDVPAECERYEGAIHAAGGIDLQVLGIGTEGHIGFNERSSSLASRTRIKTLTAQTRSDNARFFSSAGEVPMHVITMGVGTIMEARHVVLLAFGSNKAEPVAAAVEGPVTAMNPASILQMHPRATLLLDEAAASRLAHADYYRWVYDHKPAWQRFERPKTGLD
jgi:glucosamine-6-phosphate deaminase